MRKVILLIANFCANKNVATILLVHSLFDTDRQITSFRGHLVLVVTDDLKVKCNQGTVTMVIAG